MTVVENGSDPVCTCMVKMERGTSRIRGDFLLSSCTLALKIRLMSNDMRLKVSRPHRRHRRRDFEPWSDIACKMLLSGK